MKTKLLALTVTAFLSAGLLSCDKSSPFNADALGNIVGAVAGNEAGHLVKASGHILTAASMSEADEDALGQSVGVQLTNTYGVVNNPALQKYVSLVGLTVASASSNPSGNYVFGVLESSTVNAFSGPNGYIFITRGTLANCRNEAELAGVLAHEIAHVIHHDGLNQVKAAEQQGALKELVRASSEAAQFAVFADAGVDIITKQGYTQPQEFSADDTGVQIASAAGYDPKAYLVFLQRLAQAEGSGGNRLMSTHPAAAKRVDKVAAAVAKLPPGGQTLADRYTKYVK